MVTVLAGQVAALSDTKSTAMAMASTEAGIGTGVARVGSVVRAVVVRTAIVVDPVLAPG